MPNIYVSTSCLGHKLGLNDILEIYWQNGFHGVELGFIQGRVEDLDILKAYRFNYLIHNYFPPEDPPFLLNIASSSLDELERSMSFVKKCLVNCSKYEIPMYSLHAGFRSTGIPTETGIIFNDVITPYEKAFNTMVESLTKINKWADEYGITVLIENNVSSSEASGFVGEMVLLQTPEEFHKLFDIINLDKIKILLDLGHLKVASTWLKFDLEEAVTSMKRNTSMLHLHDNDGKFDQHHSISKSSVLLPLIKKYFNMHIPLVIEPHCDSIEEVCMNLKTVVDYLQ